MPKEKIHAFHKKDFKSILDDLEMLDKFEKGNLVCFYCKVKITDNNLFGLLVIENNIVPICNKTECSEKAIKVQVR